MKSKTAASETIPAAIPVEEIAAHLFAALWCHPDTIQLVDTFLEEAQKLISRQWMERMTGPSYELHIGTTCRLYADASRAQERRNGTL
jgi:hypothetical protein